MPDPSQNPQETWEDPHRPKPEDLEKKTATLEELGKVFDAKKAEIDAQDPRKWGYPMRLPTHIEFREITEELSQHVPGLQFCGAQLYFKAQTGKHMVFVPWFEVLAHQDPEGLTVQGFYPEANDPGYFRDIVGPNEACASSRSGPDLVAAIRAVQAAPFPELQEEIQRLYGVDVELHGRELADQLWRSEARFVWFDE